MSAELCTEQGDRIKTALESLKDFGSESVIFFRPDGVELVGKDNAGVVDIRLVMPAQKIRSTGGSYAYDCPDPQIELGIRTKVVATALKRFSPGDRVIIGARKGVQREFYISCRNKGKNFTSEIVAPAVENMERVIPNVTGVFRYEGSIVMNSAAFHSIVGDLLTAEPPVIMFDCDGRSLRLSGEGIFSKSSVDIGDSRLIPEDTRQQNAATFQRSSSTWAVHESYATNHLQRIAKAKNMSPKITLSIQQNVPASFEYDTPIGKLTYIVCARVAEDIDDPKFKGPAAPAPERKRKRFTVTETPAEYDSDGLGVGCAAAAEAEDGSETEDGF